MLRQAQHERGGFSPLRITPELPPRPPHRTLAGMTFWADMLHCRGGVFYTGHTDNLERRMGQHTAGSIPGFTKTYAPVTLVWCQEFPTRIEALEAERRIKGWGGAKKLALIRGDWALISALARNRAAAH